MRLGMPVDIRDLVKSSSQIQEMREQPVRIAVFVELDASDALVETVRTAFRPHTANASLHIEVAEPDVKLVVDPAVDAVIGLVGSGRAGLAEQLEAARDRAIPTAAVALAENSPDVADLLGHPYRDTMSDLDPTVLVEEELGEWLVERIPGKRLAFAANFAFMRRAAALEAVRNTAWQNGLIGVVAVLPGTDLPLMTANQAKMVLQIAAAYGEELGIERARELFGVVGGAFVFRAAARQMLAFLPGFGWAIKGGIGATGTLAMGYAAMSYFENGADAGLSERFEKLKKKLSRGSSASKGESLETLEASELEPLPPAEVTASAPGGDSRR